VATKQQARGSRRAPAKQAKASAKGKGRPPASTRNRSGGNTTRGATKLTREPVVGDAVKQVFAGHGHDVWGVLLILVGIVAGLGLYGDVAGPLGRALATGAGAAVGKAGYLVPPVLVVLGALLIRGPRTDEDGQRDLARMARPVIGALIVLVAAIGILGLTGGSPGFDAPLDSLVAAGGYLGAALGVPLKSVLGSWGAGLVFAALGIVGVVVLTDTHLRTAAGRTADGVRPAGTFVGRAWRSLFELGHDDEYELDDTELGADLEPEPKPKRAPKQKLIDLSLDDDDDEDEHEPTRRIELATPAVFVAGEDDAPPEDDVDDVPTIGLPDAEDEPTAVEQLEIGLGPAARQSPWKLPPAKLLSRSETQEVDAKEVEELGHTLERALAAHGVETRLVGMVVGPTVTRYELELGPGVKVARVTSLHKDIAYAMASPDVRILAPIPGRQAIGVEVPNVNRQVVAVGDILSSEEARKATHPLEVAIGRDINGRAVLANLSQMPHILIAGATGAGKSSCINSLITSILMRSTPDQVRLILVDPKRVELGQYNRLPHLLTQVVTNPKKAANALTWAVREMERRYDLLSEIGFRDINGYNAAYDRGELYRDPSEGVEYQRLPYILIVVDELNDLMMVAARDVEESICRIAQMARAVGIHLVIATQRPSVNVITGVIKANVPARLAFAVSSLADSRVILDQGGAEKLLGRGDMLLLGPSSSVAQRIQGAWVTEAEVRAVVGFWRRQSPEVSFDEAVQGTEGSSVGNLGSVGGNTGGDDDDEELVRQAMELVVRSQLGSTSMLQRKLRVGFARAGRLMDLLEQRGVVGPSEGSKARAVLMTPEELDAATGADLET